MSGAAAGTSAPSSGSSRGADALTNGRSRLPPVVVVLVAVIIVLVVVIAVLLGLADPAADLPLEVAKALISLTAALLVSGVVSAVIGQQVRIESRHETTTRAATTAVQDLKSAYELTSQARFRLQASATALSVMAEVETLLKARVILQRLQRESIVGHEVDETLQLMLDDLQLVFDEYQNHHTAIVEASLLEQRAQRRFLDGLQETLDVQPLVAGAESYPSLARFLQTTDAWKEQPFHRGYRTVRRAFLELAANPKLTTTR